MTTKKGVWNLQQVRDKQLQSLWSYSAPGGDSDCVVAGCPDVEPDTLTPMSEYVNKHEQAQPDYVYKVPVPGRRFKAEVVVSCKMPLGDTNQHDNQHQGPQNNVGAMKAGQHEKSAAINT